MKRKISFFCLLLIAFSVFSQSVAKGYGGVELGMSLEQVKKHKWITKYNNITNL